MSESAGQPPWARLGETCLVFDVDRPTLSADLDLREALTEALATERHLILDLTDVEDVDLAGVEFLATARRTLSERGHDLVLQNLRENLSQVLVLTGLQGGGTPRAAGEDATRPSGGLQDGGG